MAKLEQRILALENYSGDRGIKIVIRSDNKTEEEARIRAGLMLWKGCIIYASKLDERL
jgi:hypothetical protein